MATYLPGSGALSINDINTLFGRGNNLNAYRGTTYYTSSSGPFTFPSGSISMSNFYGTGPQANRPALSYTFSSNTANASLNVASLSGYVAGTSDITITVNSGVYLYATSTANAGLTLSGGTTGDTVTLVNNGFIMGMGGNGGGWVGTVDVNPTAGGVALSLGFNTTINNTNGSAYIGGGGGGGQRNQTRIQPGGGGAGGGSGGNSDSGGTGGAGGGLGGSGANGAVGTFSYKGVTYYGGGGGGGRIFPGTGGTGGTPASTNGKGGGAGGGGGQISSQYPTTRGGNGGSANAAGEDGVWRTYTFEAGGGGGGGWGASGGSAPYTGAGAGGGRAVALNGRSVTWVSGNTSRVYGGVS